ncbi:hypothetical protein G5V59_27450 [Nocardioides sp. W3-2-3]|nr:hypothetical protein [Nocardioides convexus]
MLRPPGDQDPRAVCSPTSTRSRLIADPTQDDQDVYERLLRYVEADRTDLGALLLRRGAARTREDHPPVQRHEKYAGNENAAQQGDRGLWAACPR